MTSLVDVSQADKSRAANCPKEAWILCVCGGSGVSGYSGFPCNDCGGSGGLPPDWLETMLAEHRLTAEQANAAEIAEWKEAHDFYAGLYAERCGQVAGLTALLREAREQLNDTSAITGNLEWRATLGSLVDRIDAILNKSAQTTASENPHHG